MGPRGCGSPHLQCGALIRGSGGCWGAHHSTAGRCFPRTPTACTANERRWGPQSIGCNRRRRNCKVPQEQCGGVLLLAPAIPGGGAPVDKDRNCTGSDAITNKRDAVVPPSRPVDPRTVHRCYVGDSPQPTWEGYGEGLHSPLFIRSQARLTKTVKVSYRVAEAHAGPDRRFLPSHTRVSLLCGEQLQEGWVLIRQHSGSLSTGSSAGRLTLNSHPIIHQGG